MCISRHLLFSGLHALPTCIPGQLEHKSLWLILTSILTIIPGFSKPKNRPENFWRRLDQTLRMTYDA
ncbi:MAG: hypothetical protein D5S03_13330 [Desulfonatronospira sp. MSAO_Bac3]|nr:MAG: hypothetical protein D5S03_13330 [Desulfonatronospira sp. MSAO_Bac3]